MKLTDHQASSLRMIVGLGTQGRTLDRNPYDGRVAAALRRLELVTIEERDGERIALATATGRAWIETDDARRAHRAEHGCYACDGQAAGWRDLRPEGGHLERACQRHREPRLDPQPEPTVDPRQLSLLDGAS